jgi:hypothetical protein
MAIQIEDIPNILNEISKNNDNNIKLSEYLSIYQAVKNHINIEDFYPVKYVIFENIIQIYNQLNKDDEALNFIKDFEDNIIIELENNKYRDAFLAEDLFYEKALILKRNNKHKEALLSIKKALEINQNQGNLDNKQAKFKEIEKEIELKL